MKRRCLVTDEKGDHELSNYIIPVIAAVVVLFILAVMPLKMNTKLLVKVVVVSLLIFVLTYLLYSLYSLYVAGAGFIFLLLYFSYLISRQQEFASKRAKVYSPALYVRKPKQETSQVPAADEEEKLPKAAQMDGVQQEINKQSADSQLSESGQEIISDHDGVSITEKSTEYQLTDITQENSAIYVHDAELELFVQLSLDNQANIQSPESDLENPALLEINSFETETSASVEVTDQEETNLAAEIESSLEDFRIERVPLINKSNQLFDIEINGNEEELEESFEGRNRDVILADEEVEKETDKQPVSKASSLKETILQKRSKLFEELEDDL